MRVTSKGQVTIPQDIRKRLGIKPGTEVEFRLDGDGARLERARSRQGAKVVRRMRGRATVGMSTDDIMALTRDDG
jgi:AbrB family looped-hinge helix DNA binding protein